MVSGAGGRGEGGESGRVRVQRQRRGLQVHRGGGRGGAAEVVRGGEGGQLVREVRHLLVLLRLLCCVLCTDPQHHPQSLAWGGGTCCSHALLYLYST